MAGPSKIDDGGATAHLQEIGSAVQHDFSSNRRVLSFSEYLALVQQSPLVQLRNSAQYLLDMFDHYGTREVRHPTGAMRRFNLFDLPWTDGRGRLVGQEEVQNRIYSLLNGFTRQGRVDRCILMHGPNGSSKSTISDILAHAMEHYSTLDEGALYRFGWVFPTHALQRGGIGFSASDDPTLGSGESFAHLDESAVDARVPCELRDHPLLLIPKQLRRRLIEGAIDKQHGSRSPTLSEYLLEGDLCHKCKQIFEALLVAYEGDYARVLRHVQVERFYVSRRYRVGAARVEPQMAVDARTRQVTADRSLSALPSALQSIALHEVDGELAQANRGLIDFADIFKRPLEAYKYLLSTVESGQVALDQSNLFVDTVFIASANETHLNALMQSPEWMSFKGRMELVRVPYLLDFELEREIYDAQLSESHVGKPVAPHTTEAVALWAVLTRMRKPDPVLYDESMRDSVGKLTPLEKAALYADTRVPERMGEDSVKVLSTNVRALYRETQAAVSYEGRFGASAREAKAILSNAAQHQRHECLAPEAVLAEIEALIQQTSVYEFLRQEPREPGFHDQTAFIEVVRQWCLDRADDEVRGAMGLVDQSSYEELFERYVRHVTHFVRKEKLANPITGGFDQPDAKLMADVEQMLELDDDGEAFRQRLMTRIGAWSVDHPGQKPDYTEIFRDQFTRIRERYYLEQRSRVKRLIQQALLVLADESSGLNEEDISKVRQMLTNLEQEYGYCDVCAREILVNLARHRYAD